MLFLRSELILILLMSVSLLGGADVYLEELPWTDAAWFWTQDGVSLPKINTNLSGKGKIRIGGREFDRGICGHTGFSIVYNLDQTADSFTVFLGVDVELHPKDKKGKSSVKFKILTDRKEVFQKELFRGEVPHFIKIDLSGKTQLELRAEFGENFQLQKPVFAQPVIQTSQPEKLRQTLQKNRARWTQKRNHTPNYNVPDNWKKISIRKESIDRFQNAYRIENQYFSLLLVPEFGGRIMEFRTLKGKSCLTKDFAPADSALSRGRGLDHSGGHFMRVMPGNSFHPDEPLLLHGKYEIHFPEEGKIIMRSPESLFHLIRYEYHLQIKPDSPELKITNVMVNTAPFSRPLGIWSLTRLNPEFLKTVWIPRGKEEVQNTVKSLAISRGEQEIRLDFGSSNLPESEYFELRLWSQQAWIRLLTPQGATFRITYSVGKKFQVGPQVHLFLCKKFAEFESHGMVRELSPGESVQFTEYWNTVP